MATATTAAPEASQQQQQPHKWPTGRYLTPAQQEAIARRNLQIVAWRAMGYQMKEIAAVYGITESMVSYVCKRMGLQPPRPSLPPLPTTKSA